MITEDLLQEIQQEIQNSKIDKQINNNHIFPLIEKLDSLQNSFFSNKQKIDELYKILVNKYMKIFPFMVKKFKNQLFLSLMIQGFNNFVDLNDNVFNKVNSKLVSKTILKSQEENIEAIFNQIELSDQQKLIYQAQQLENYINQNQKILEDLDNELFQICPNILRLVGALVSCLLLKHAGDLKSLSMMPSCNIQILGESHQQTINLRLDGKTTHVGVFRFHPLFDKQEPNFQKKFVKFLANGVAKMSKIDYSQFCKNGEEGKKLFQQILLKMSNIKNPKEYNKKNPLKIPGTYKSARRGGKRLRKNKQRFEITELRRMKNTLKFGEISDGNLLEDIGMIGQENSRNLKIRKEKTNLQMSRKMNKNYEHHKSSEQKNNQLLMNQNNQIEIYQRKLPTGIPQIQSNYSFHDQMNQQTLIWSPSLKQEYLSNYTLQNKMRFALSQHLYFGFLMQISNINQNQPKFKPYIIILNSSMSTILKIGIDQHKRNLFTEYVKQLPNYELSIKTSFLQQSQNKCHFIHNTFGGIKMNIEKELSLGYLLKRKFQDNICSIQLLSNFKSFDSIKIKAQVEKIFNKNRYNHINIKFYSEIVINQVNFDIEQSLVLNGFISSISHGIHLSNHDLVHYIGVSKGGFKLKIPLIFLDIFSKVDFIGGVIGGCVLGFCFQQLAKWYQRKQGNKEFIEERKEFKNKFIKQQQLIEQLQKIENYESNENSLKGVFVVSISLLQELNQKSEQQQLDVLNDLKDPFKSVNLTIPFRLLIVDHHIYIPKQRDNILGYLEPITDWRTEESVYILLFIETKFKKLKRILVSSNENKIIDFNSFMQQLITQYQFLENKFQKINSTNYLFKELKIRRIVF